LYMGRLPYTIQQTHPMNLFTNVLKKIVLRWTGNSLCCV